MMEVKVGDEIRKRNGDNIYRVTEIHEHVAYVTCVLLKSVKTLAIYVFARVKHNSFTLCSIIYGNMNLLLKMKELKVGQPKMKIVVEVPKPRAKHVNDILMKKRCEKHRDKTKFHRQTEKQKGFGPFYFFPEMAYIFLRGLTTERFR